MKKKLFLIAIFFRLFMGSAEDFIPDTSYISISDTAKFQTIESKENLYNRGLKFYQSGNFSQAVLCIDSCLSLDSTFTGARFIKALALEKEGNLIGAISEYEKIKEKMPENAEVDKLLKKYYFTTYLSKNWYYMLAMLLILIILMAIVVRSLSYKKM